MHSTECLSEEQKMAGQVEGLASYPPLHIVCARRDPGAAKVRTMTGRIPENYV